MKVRLGNWLAGCPYCGSTDFLPPDEGGGESRELACAECGGLASRSVILERLAESAGELGLLALARLKEERRQKRRQKRKT